MTTDAKAVKKGGLYGAYQLDNSLETDGSWQDVRGGAQVKVRYENSPRVLEAARRLDKKYRTIIMTEGGLPAEIQEQRDIELCATDIIADWKGVTDRDGNELPCSPANIRIVLKDLPDLRRDVVYASRVSENFRAGEQAKISGN